MSVITVKGLVKRFGKVEALRGLTFSVPQGSLCGFIGLNGAGKSTTLKALLGICRADEGEASVFSLRTDREAESMAIRRRTAYLPEGKRLFPYMNVRQVIEFVRPFYPGWRRDREAQLLKAFDLPADRNVNQLSKGMLAKLHMLLALARGCELVILDEPTDGLDAIAVEETLQEMTKQVAEDGTTILFCSHRLEEIEQVVDHLVIIHEGRALLEAPIDQLRAQARRLTAVLPDGISAAGTALAGQGALQQDGRSMALTVWQEPTAAINALRELGATGIEADPIPLRRLFVDMVRKTKEVDSVVA